jgi:prevent-host-death family protein
MKTIELNEANAPLSDYAANTRNGALVVTNKGKPVFALVSLKGMDFETLSLSGNPKFMKIVDDSRKSIEREGAISSDEMRRRLALRPKKRAR